MKPIKFKGQNIVFGENQKEYQPLPALRLPDGEVITCWEITDEELEEITRTKKIFLKQLTFNRPIQPLMPMVSLDSDLKITEE